MLRVALFDLDDTLYAAETGLWPAIGERIERYMVERLGLAAADVRALRHHYFQAYGTTLNGLRLEFKVEAHDYLNYVHDLPLEQFLRPDPALDQMLARLPLAKVVFTNADAAHARRVLEQLGIASHFSAIIDIHALAYISKPQPGAYQQALRLLNAEPRACVFADDSPRNLGPANDLGMLTVLVDRTGLAAPPGVDFVVPNILALEPVLLASGRLAAPPVTLASDHEPG